MQVIKVLQLTDLHMLEFAGKTLLGVDTDHTFRLSIQHAYANHGPFDLMLLTGDLAQDPCSASYQRLKQHLQAYQTPCLCLPGNHDDFDVMQRFLQGDRLSCDSHKLLGNWAIIALNSQKVHSPVGLLANNELLMLEKMLSAYPNRPTLIAMHHPCVASGSPWLDTMQIENSAELIGLIERFKQVKIIACGHIHQEFSCQLGDVAVLATPSTCFQFTPNADDFSLDTNSPGYRVLELFADDQWRSHCHRIPEGLPTLDRTAHNY